MWALALDGRNADVLASGGGDGAVAIWEDCTSADADEAAAATAVAVLKEQDLANALQVGAGPAVLAALRWRRASHASRHRALPTAIL